MSDSYTFKTKADEEAAIASYARMTAHVVRISFKNEWGVAIADAPATDIYDACRDAAYDVLRVAERPGTDLVDLILGDVTEAAVTLVLG